MRKSTRRLPAVLLVLALAQVTAPPVAAVGETQFAMNRVGEFALPGTFSIAFSSRAPYAYAHAKADGGVVVTIDIADPAKPRKVGRAKVTSAHGYMEDMSLGERDDGTTFVLVRQNDGLRVVDVTKPDDPRPRGFLPPEDGGESHTWTCLGRACAFAYGTRASLLSGTPGFQVVDLSDLDAPKIVSEIKSLVGVIHDWNEDRAAVMWSVGGSGIAAYDVTEDPRDPTPLNGSDPRFGAMSPSNEYNDWLQLHGSLRPNARRFEPDLGKDSASVERGNVLLVSEEGNDVDCTDSFQTWHVPHLDAARFTPGAGSITPLDSWSLRDADPATRPVAAELCSVHWFDYHQAGFVVMATYGSGTRVLDVRDARSIRQVAYHFEHDNSQALQSYWVPERATGGRTTGRATNIVYTADAGTVTAPLSQQLTGGIDIFQVPMPQDSRKS